MKNIFTLCFFLLFSAQTHGAGKWRERFSRFLPFVAPKARKLEKNRKTQLAKMATSLSDLELAVLDLELKGHADDIEIVDEMALMVREEIYRRIGKGEHANFLEILNPAWKTQLDSILNDSKTALDSFGRLQNFTQKDPLREYRNILDKFFFANTKDIVAFNPTSKQSKNIKKAIYTTDVSTKILQEMLNRGRNAEDFFATFNIMALPSPPNKYQNTLDNFFTKNAEGIGELSLSPEQIEHISRYIERIPTLIAFLKQGLEHSEGNADKFFAIFKAVSWQSHPTDSYQNELDSFFTGNIDAIGELSLSAKQIEHISRHIERIPTLIAFLKQGLKHSEGDADKFFAIFKAVSWQSHPTDSYQNELDSFFTGNIDAIWELSLSAEQIEHISRHIERIPTLIALLKQGLEHSEGDADKFFAIFKAVSWQSHPTDSYQNELDSFFTGNIDAIGELSLSAEQIEHISRHIERISTLIALLKQGLEHSEGDADKFFAIYKAVSWQSHPTDSYQNELDSFFTRNIDAIGELSLSAEQIEHISRHIERIPTLIALLKQGLKHSEGDADKFFAILDAVTWQSSPSNPYLNALENFFTHHAKSIMSLGPSVKQIERVRHYAPSATLHTTVKDCAVSMAVILSQGIPLEDTE